MVYPLVRAFWMHHSLADGILVEVHERERDQSLARKEVKVILGPGFLAYDNLMIPRELHQFLLTVAS